MTVETASYIAQLDPTLPANSDFLSEGDDHITMLKAVLQNTFGTTAGIQYDLDDVVAQLASLTAELAAYRVPIGAIMAWQGNASTIPSGWVFCDGQTHVRSDGGGNITAPDLRDRYVKCVVNDTDFNTTGGHTSLIRTSAAAGIHVHGNPSTGSAGSHTHGGNTGFFTLTTAQMPAHNHGGGFHSHTEDTISVGQSNPSFGTRRLLSDGTNTGASIFGVTINGTSVINTEGGGDPHRHTIVSDGSHTHTTGATHEAGAHTHTTDVANEPLYRALYYIMKI